MAGSGHNNDKTLEYSGRRRGTLFIVQTYSCSLVSAVYNHWIFILDPWEACSKKLSR